MHRTNSDRGAILVHVAIAFVGIFLLTGFVIDYGTFWVARGQAQNAADAGALAGTVARVYDDTSDPPASTTTGKVPDSVYAAIAGSPIWGVAPPQNTVNISWVCPDGTNACVAVDVYRDGTNNSSTLPTFFLKLVNINSQGTRAHAVAEAVAANEVGCARPWFMIDQYTDTNGDGQFDAGDSYTAPGFQLPRDLGEVVAFHNNQSPSGYGQLDVGQGKSGAGLRDAIENCGTGDVAIGETLNTVPGGKVGPESQGTQQLIDWDPGASWDATTDTIVGSCATSGGCTCGGAGCPNGKSISPRVVVTAICSPLEANCAAGGQSNGTIVVTNLLAFFITGPAQGNGNNLTIPAVLVSTAGNVVPSGTPTPNGSFVKAVTLIR